jgi:hypothetical protein
LGALGTGLAATALPAYASAVTSNSYAIGTPGGAVSGVTATPATLTTGTTGQGFQVKFTATAALGSASTITITDSTGTNAVAGIATAVEVLNDTVTSDCIQPGGGVATPGAAGGLVVTLGSSCSIPAGDVGEVDFTSTVPASSFDFIVSAPSGATTATSNTLTVNSVPPTLAAAVTTVGTNTTYTIGGLGSAPAGVTGWSHLATAVNTLTMTASGTIVGGTSIAWYNGAAGYSVTYTPSGGVATADTVSSAVLGATANIVVLTLASTIPISGTATVTATGETPTVSGTAVTVTIVPGSPAAEVAQDETTSSVTFGGSVSAVTVSAAPALAGAQGATYTVDFKTATGLASGAPGSTITVTEPNTTFSGVTSVLIKDTTSGAYCVVAPTPTPPATHTLIVSLLTADGCPTTTTGGDVLSLEFTGVTNPTSTGTVSDFAVNTSADTVAVDAASYVIGVSSVTGIGVTATPATPGALATYVITNVIASAALTAGSLAYEITLTAPAGTVFPAAASDISIKDNTTASGSGTVGTLVSGGGTDAIVFEVPEAVTSADNLTITVLDVANPSNAGSYQLSLNGDVTAPAVSAPPFPDANTSYPSGGIVDFAGTYYVFAGGHPFGFPTVPTLQAVQLIDDAVVQTAATTATVPTTAPAVGTTIIVYNNPTIYVVAANGQLNGFATEAQFTGDGYDPADVITVPNFGGLTVGATAGSVGAADNALALAGNGAIVDSSGTFYVAAGGHGFGIPTPAVLAAVQAGDSAIPLVGTVPAAWSTAPILNGTIVTLNGTVFVAFGGSLYGIKSEAQLAADGFGGTPSIVIPNAGGLALVDIYTGA